MKRFLRYVAGATFGLSLTALAVNGCGSATSKSAGTEGGPCLTDGTCDTGLECLSNFCVRPGGAGGAGGQAGATGAAGAAAGTGGHATGGAAGGGGQSAAGASGSAGAGGAGGACTPTPDSFTLASSACMSCIAMHCCELYNACESDPNCQLALEGGTSQQSGGPPLVALQSCDSTNSCKAICPTAF